MAIGKSSVLSQEETLFASKAKVCLPESYRSGTNLGA
ncbi:hypothetical protein FOCG_09046 [Fusarium oxysporum f. sp. radicis-lycopersici 26381]|uniref:Uncharacterized protein n=1 Tax=Fusarium oxysporum Fo47 TaxID=660027 RepID=W9KD61_FUSOX|nr:hypothetical protein FOZG_08453 [Fusarium oxysporum Fo47]EWZ83722.1 hypothetical protein FOWG_12657 [Fusarium oxysporum f. sp. lycopersici MN25]EXL50872.1 hypothetical protein FOCG_09046 [Fusarium oxysporum f. sp. radicis-lycopersici 26381]